MKKLIQYQVMKKKYYLFYLIKFMVSILFLFSACEYDEDLHIPSNYIIRIPVRKYREFK